MKERIKRILKTGVISGIFIFCVYVSSFAREENMSSVISNGCGANREDGQLVNDSVQIQQDLYIGEYKYRLFEIDDVYEMALLNPSYLEDVTIEFEEGNYILKHNGEKHLLKYLEENMFEDTVSGSELSLSNDFLVISLGKAGKAIYIKKQESNFETMDDIDIILSFD